MHWRTKKHGETKFDAEYVCMNPGYSPKNLDMIKENAKILNVDLQIFNSNIFEVVDSGVFKKARATFVLEWEEDTFIVKLRSLAVIKSP